MQHRFLSVIILSLIFVFALIIATGAALPASATATAYAPTACLPVITVTSTLDSGAGSLRQAIADVCAGGTITWDTSLSGLTTTLTSTLHITKNLTIAGSGLAAAITLDGNNTVRILKVTNNARFTLTDLRLTRGRDPSTECDSQTYYAPTWVSCGGGMKIEAGTVVTATGVTVQYSDAYMGGGIYNAGTLRMENSTITGNTAGEGGGLHNTSYLGGVGMLTVLTCTIASNSADAASRAGVNAGLNTGGGGIYDYSGTVLVRNSTLSGNTVSSPSSGGGLHTFYGSVLIQNSTFSGNSAFDAGGIYNYWATVTLHNSTLSTNSSSWHSGGIHAFYGTLHYQNTIIANSVGGDCGYTFSGPIGTNINNLVEDGSCSAAFGGDPVLGPLADNGDSTRTHALLPGSPAIDAGDAASCSTTDQRGVTRPQGVACDIGAFESRGFTLTRAGGDTQATPINLTFTQPLSVTVTSAYAEPVAGGLVTFVGPLAGASTNPITLTAPIANGVAVPIVAANGTLGSYTVTASAIGASGSVNFTLTNLKGNTTTTVASSPNPSTVGQLVTFTATVTSPSGAPTGSVQFYKNGATFGAPIPLAAGTALTSTAALAVGSHPITATYSGEPTYNASTSATYTHTVNKVSTTTSITSSPNPSTYGQSVTFTATVTSTSGMPTGTVAFKDGGTTISGCGAQSLPGGQATCATSALTVGSHTLTAEYSGGTNYAASTSTPLAQTVNKASTTTRVTSSPNPSVYGQSVTFTATVTSTSGTPTDSITLTLGTTNIGPLTLNDGAATYVTNTLPAGTHPITATYGGSNTYLASSGSLSGGQIVNDVSITGLAASNSSPTRLTNATFFTVTISAGSNVVYQWNFGDGQTANGAAISHIYTATGTYTATVTATNGAGSIPATTLVVIEPIKVYLPLILNRY